MNLDALLRAHSFMRVERPSELWDACTDDQHLIPLLGEMIAACLARSSGQFSALTLNASNVVVPAEASADGGPPFGEFVALTVKGAVRWEADAVWLTEKPWSANALEELTQRLAPASVRYAYIRSGPVGSITIFLGRRNR